MFGELATVLVRPLGFRREIIWQIFWSSSPSLSSSSAEVSPDGMLSAKPIGNQSISRDLNFSET